MEDVAANSAKKTSDQRELSNSFKEHIALHLCYGQIGISAVAAAARYQGDFKNPAYAPAAVGSNKHGATLT
jgi:hypothetical protein